MMDRLPVIDIPSLPAELAVEVTAPVSRDVYAMFYRRGSKDCLHRAKVHKLRGECNYRIPIPDAVAKWPPGRYEVRVTTMRGACAAAYELRFGTVLKLGEAKAVLQCGDSCCV